MSPDLDKSFFLRVDAYENGFGVILKQLSDDNNQHLVAYASRATNEAEKKYPPTHNVKDVSNYICSESF